MKDYSISPAELAKSIWKNRRLILSLIKRDVISRYRGSVMGLMWSFFNPVLMLAVYTFVFSAVFKARWAGGTDSKTEFALVLFAGLIVFNLFSECLNRAPSLILGNTNYVKKVIFPLEVLPVIALGGAIFHFSISLLVWLVFYLIFFGIPHATIILLPIVVAPILLMTLGFSWLLAALGVYLRDVSQIVGAITMVLMMLSPIFYPVDMLPEAYRPFIQFSPLTFIVEQVRDVMIWGKTLDLLDWTIYSGISVTVNWLGFAWFQKVRKGFADVV